MRMPRPLLLPLLAALAVPGVAAEDPALVHARRLLKKSPIIDGHNDLPWAIRENAKAPMDVGAYDLRGDDRGPHRPRAPPRGRRRRPVLVGLHPGRDPRRLRPHAARADRHRAARDRALSGRARGRRHRGRRQAGHEARARRLAARGRGRPRDRELARSPARLLRPRRALHDPHPQRDPRLGGRRRRHPAPLGPHPVRRGGRARDEPARHARRPVARDPGDHGRRAPRVGGAR